MIEVNELTKWYGPTLALDGISFSVKKGEIVGFIGPNGAGKTTTMKILTTYTHATSGSARLAGFDVRTRPLDVRRHIGYLPEHNPLYIDMKVKEYLDFMADLRAIGKVERKKQIERVVASCGLGPVFEREIRELSKGFRQRVGLAQAMVHNPDILILDEPTSGLDPNQIVEVRNLIKEIGKEKTVILSTHTLVEVALTADRILVIHRGRLVARGTLGEIRALAALDDRARLGLQGAAAGMNDALSSLPGVKSAAARGRDGGMEKFELTLAAGTCVEENIFNLARDKGWVVSALETHRASLEEIFNALTIGKDAAEEPAAASPESEAAE